MELIMKQCLKCHTDKQLSEFYKDNSKKDKLTIYCKDCCKALERRNHQKEPWKKIQRNKRYKNVFLESTGAYPTLEEMDSMIKMQDNKCGICKNTMTKPCVDHNHSTGHIRMLLCHHCNVMLGHGRENVEIFTNAIEYIKRFNL